MDDPAPTPGVLPAQRRLALGPGVVDTGATLARHARMSGLAAGIFARHAQLLSRYPGATGTGAAAEMPLLARAVQWVGGTDSAEIGAAPHSDPGLESGPRPYEFAVESSLLRRTRQRIGAVLAHQPAEATLQRMGVAPGALAPTLHRRLLARTADGVPLAGATPMPRQPVAVTTPTARPVADTGLPARPPAVSEGLILSPEHLDSGAGRDAPRDDRWPSGSMPPSLSEAAGETHRVAPLLQQPAEVRQTPPRLLRDMPVLRRAHLGAAQASPQAAATPVPLRRVEAMTAQPSGQAAQPEGGPAAVPSARTGAVAMIVRTPEPDSALPLAVANPPITALPGGRATDNATRPSKWSPGGGDGLVGSAAPAGRDNPSASLATPTAQPITVALPAAPVLARQPAASGPAARILTRQADIAAATPIGTSPVPPSSLPLHAATAAAPDTLALSPAVEPVPRLFRAAASGAHSASAGISRTQRSGADQAAGAAAARDESPDAPPSRGSAPVLTAASLAGQAGEALPGAGLPLAAGVTGQTAERAPAVQPAAPMLARQAEAAAGLADAAPRLVWRSPAAPPQQPPTGEAPSLMRSVDSAPGPATAAPAATVATSAEVSPAAASGDQLDLQLLAERVTRLIVRGLDIERERRGTR